MRFGRTSSEYQTRKGVQTMSDENVVPAGDKSAKHWALAKAHAIEARNHGWAPDPKEWALIQKIVASISADGPEAELEAELNGPVEEAFFHKFRGDGETPEQALRLAKEAGHLPTRSVWP